MKGERWSKEGGKVLYVTRQCRAGDGTVKRKCQMWKKQQCNLRLMKRDPRRKRKSRE